MKRINTRIKVTFFLIIALLIIIVLLIKVNDASTKNNASPESLYENNLDFFVYQKTAYVNASTIEWVHNLELAPEKQVGVILRTNVKKNFKDFDATSLVEGTTIYAVKDRKDILLVLIDEQYVPYYQYTEG